MTDENFLCIYVLRYPIWSWEIAQLVKIFAPQHEDLPPTLKKKKKMDMIVCTYSHSTGEAEMDGSLGLTS